MDQMTGPRIQASTNQAKFSNAHSILHVNACLPAVPIEASPIARICKQKACNLILLMFLTIY